MRDTGSTRADAQAATESPSLSRRQALISVALAGLAALQLIPLLFVAGDGVGLPRWRGALPEGHDVAFHAIVGHEYLRSVGEGVLVPRWIEPVAGGLGAPVFSYYPPLTYNVARALDSVTPGGSVNALRATAVAASLLSLIAFWALARDRLSTFGALGATVVYALSASRAIDLHERFALPTHVAYVWLPLVLLLFDRVVGNPSRVTVQLALAITCAGLVLTHSLSAVLVLYGLLPYVAWRLLEAPGGQRLRVVLALTRAAGVAALLAAVLLAPLALDADLVDSEWIRESPHGQYERNFLWSDEEALGFSKAVIKPQVEAAALSLVLLGTLALAGCLVARHVDSRSSSRAGRGDEPVALAALGLWLLYLQTPWSSWLWEWLPGLSWAQFPWRFGGLSTLVVALLTGHALSALASRFPSRSARFVSLALLTLGLLAQPHWRDWPTSSLRDSDDLTALAPRLVVEEYLPQRIEPRRVEELAQTERARVLGGGSADVETWRAELRRVNVSLDEPGQLLLRTWFHPGWRARVNGESAEVMSSVDRGLSLQAVVLPAGESSVELRYVDTLAGQAGRWISLGGWVVVLVLLGRSLRRPRLAASNTDSLDVAERP